MGAMAKPPSSSCSSLSTPCVPMTGLRLLGIGVGAPGIIDTSTGTVRWSVLNWAELRLGPQLEERYGMPVVVANDSHAAALAELTFFRRPRPNNLIVIRVGRGVGAGIILNGQLFQGDGYGAGEFGHVSMSGADAPCRCGKEGCLETMASMRALVDAAWRRRAVDHRRARPRGRLPGRRHRHPADRPRCRARARHRDRLADRRAQRSPRAAGRPGRASSATNGSARSGGTPGRASCRCSHATRRSSSATSMTMSSCSGRRRC